jgi:hypothetical protein
VRHSDRPPPHLPRETRRQTTGPSRSAPQTVPSAATDVGSARESDDPTTQAQRTHQSRECTNETTRPSVTPAGCVHLRGDERAGVSKPRSEGTRPRPLASQPPRTRTRQVPFVRHVDVHTSKLVHTRHRKKRGMQAHLATTMGESCDISRLPWGFGPFDVCRSEQRPTLGFHPQLRSAFRFSQPLDALLRSRPLRSCFIPVTPLGCMLSEVSPPR